MGMGFQRTPRVVALDPYSENSRDTRTGSPFADLHFRMLELQVCKTYTNSAGRLLFSAGNPTTYVFGTVLARCMLVIPSLSLSS